MMRNERGFTIMELLVVIVIIGVLAAIGVPAYNNITDRARTSACAANRQTLDTIIAMYNADWGDYPAEARNGAELTAAVIATWIQRDEDGTAGTKPYVENVAGLKCPGAGKYTFNMTTKQVVCDKH
jgi:type II secretion system protein G